jgi:hypothetical protein
MRERAKAMKELIERNAEEVRRLHARIHDTFRLRDRSSEQKQEWQRACSEFHARYDKLAFPGGYNTANDRILAGDSEAIEAALCFIELRPYFFRSGYMFKALLPKLKRAPLSAPEAARLQAVLSAYDAWRDAKHQRQGITSRST